jgi:Polyketide cyclase / dehydrase and lipid transport
LIAASIMGAKITVSESILVRTTPERLFDFTQDYGRRAEWDASILEAEVLEHSPVPRVRIRGRGGLRAVFQYRQFERPRRTSLALEAVESAWIASGGGSWSYEERDGGTLWTQTNTLVVRAGWWRALFVPAIRANLRSATKHALERAKQLFESSGRA